MAFGPRSFSAWVWPQPPVAPRLWLAIAASTVYAALVLLILPQDGGFAPQVTVPFALVNTSVLGLLVSFRTKVAYERWWEGRVLWGGLVNHSRNFCLKVRALVGPAAGERAELAALVPAFAVALRRHLRGETKYDDLPEAARPPEGVKHAPAYLAGRVFARIAEWRAAERIDGFTQMLLDQHATALMDVCGACERVRGTPLSPSYLSLLRHGLVLGFLFTPWATVPALGWWALPAQAVVVYFLFGIELTAEAVEQPFGSDGDDLPLETYCETIRASAEEIFA